ncbi:MAG TPA: putative Ig domain-containing protein [Chthoniobacterales bacterium]|jgi:hypothetical protein|nr:putative Ig domain-containing protein [Chthoniobacterales bacterium]
MFVATSARALPNWAESYGVGSYDTTGQSNGDPFYGSGFDYPTGIAKMPDGGFIVAGQLDLPRLYRDLFSDHTSGTSDGSLVRFASDGTIIWQITLHLNAGRFSNGYYSPAPSQIQHLATDAQGNIFVSGGKGNPDNNGVTPFVAKFASDGSLVWQNGITGFYSNSYMGLTSDGGAILTGSQSRPGGGSVPVLAKFAGNGSLSFFRVYEQPNQYTEYGPVCQSADGTKYFTAIRYPLTTNSGSAYGLGLIVFDASGNVLAQHGWPSLDGANETPVDMIQTASGGFAILSVEDNYSGFTVRKFNSTGSATTLERTVSRAQGASFDIRPLSLAETADGGLLISNSTGSNASLIKIQTDGNLAFMTALGGPDNEGGPYSNGPGSTYGIATADGGYGLACTTTSYYTGVPASKPDWWVVKTDANRRIRNFSGTQVDESPGTINVSGGPQTPVSISYYMPANYGPTGSSSPDPVFEIIDLSTYQLPDLPTLAIQASSPRIVSSNAAEAVVGQHFAYHIEAAFFSIPANLTFNATGLPQGFVIDAHTGVISGAPAVGSETIQPIIITLSASDGVDTASLVLRLTIGDGAPILTVNGSDQPAYPNPSATPVAGLADTVLRFLANQPGTVAGRLMHVQATTTPSVASSWTDLTNATKGRMTFDIITGQFALSSNDYPFQQADPVYFRAVNSTQGHPDSISNVVGPFNLTSNKARLGTTRLLFTGNGSIADLYFLALESASPNGLSVRVQATTIPSVEGSWSDLTIGNSGHMGQSTDPSKFILLVNNYPATQGIYFRAVGSASGLVDSISNIVGPLDVTADIPPVVSIVPSTSLPNSGSGASPDSPILVAEGTFGVGANAQTNRSLKKLTLQVDGQTKFELSDGSKHLDYVLGGIPVGDHVLEAVAVDDLGARARAGTGATYIRVVPAAGKAERAREDQAASLQPRVFNAIRDGAWSDPGTWDQNDIPDGHDFVTIASRTISFTDAQAILNVRSLTVINATLTTPANVGAIINVSLQLTMGDCAINGGIGIVVKTNDADTALPTKCQLLNAQNIQFHPDSLQNTGFILNFGTLLVHGSGGVTGASRIINQGTIQFLPALQIPINADIDPDAAIRILQTPSFSNSGIISGIPSRVVSDNGLGLIGSDSAGLIGSDSAGLIGHDSSSVIAAGGGNIVAAGGGNVIAAGGGNVIAAGGGNIIGTNSAGIVAAGGGNVIAAGGGNFSARTRAQTDSAQSGFVQSGGETNLNAFSLIGEVTLNGGVLSGRGAIGGSLTNNGGYIAPGGTSSPGILAVTGNFTQGANGTLILEAAGGEPYQFDQVQVGGASQLDGKLDLKTINGFVPLPNDSFNPLGFGSVTGSFSSVSSNAQVTVAANGLLATLSPSAPSPTSGQPLNIATRLAIQGGDNLLIAGFIVTGPSGSTKKVLIRGLGPSLTNLGVAGAISDPLLELHTPDGSVVVNDNWAQGDTSQIPNGFAPSDSRESVIVATLTPGSYSALVKGAHGETGVGLAEVYDLESASSAKLANVATRGLVQSGDNVLIGGFIIGGTEPAKIIVRAIGPSLAAFGIPNPLPATTLELHDANGDVISNDGWRSTQESEIIATTIPPTSDDEAAIVATLVPGTYTAVVRGTNGTTGIAVIEAYNLQ